MCNDDNGDNDNNRGADAKMKTCKQATDGDMMKLAALYKHWCTADSVKQFITASVPIETRFGLPEHLVQTAQAHSSFMRLSVWYALLYVVLEGYRELKYDDRKVNAFLERADYVDAIRLFRNATFHYQTDPISDKLMKFLQLNDATDWARGLSRAFANFFQRELHVEDVLSKLRDQPS